MADRKRTRAEFAAEHERCQRHGSPGSKVQEAIRLMERLLRATAVIPEAERSELIQAAEREARATIKRLRPLASQLHKDYFPSAYQTETVDK